ncbi:MAG: hypothetical protein WHS44_07930 [Fimbriimonadales bacterium]|nr:MAG: hypothetical protein KatS3mg018_0415 [Fimbriimonadales bacterium]
MLTPVWQESLPKDTLSFDVLRLPRQPAQLLTLDEVRIQFRVWEGRQWRTVRAATHLMQRDLYALHPAHEGKTLIFTDGGCWIYTEKEIISSDPSRTVPIGRMVDKEGVARIVCFDHQEQSPYYYVLEKPLLNDQFYLAPDDLLGDEIQSLVMQIPRRARAWSVFYTNGYRFIVLLRPKEKLPAQIYGVTQDRLVRLEIRQSRPYPLQRVSLPEVGPLRREMPLCVRFGDPKNEEATRLLVMQATREKVLLTAYGV